MWGARPGQTSKLVNVSVYGDGTRESSETFFVNLLGDGVTDAQGIGTILDDDNTRGNGK